MKTDKKSLIFTILSVIGLGTTTVLAVRSGMKTRKILDENPNASGAREIVSLTWKSYIATVIAMVATGTCIISARTLDAKQIAALSGVVATGATTFSKYRSKVREIVGPEEEKQIFDAVRADDKFTCYPELIDVSEYENDTLFLDTLSGRYFYSSMPRVMHAIYHLERTLGTECSVSANDWYDYLAIDREVSLDDSVWHYEYLSTGYDMPWIDVVITDQTRFDGTPYKMISFDEPPLNTEALKEFDEDLYNMIYG